MIHPAGAFPWLWRSIHKLFPTVEVWTRGMQFCVMSDDLLVYFLCCRDWIDRRAQISLSNPAVLLAENPLLIRIRGSLVSRFGL